MNIKMSNLSVDFSSNNVKESELSYFFGRLYGHESFEFDGNIKPVCFVVLELREKPEGLCRVFGALMSENDSVIGFLTILYESNFKEYSNIKFEVRVR